MKRMLYFLCVAALTSVFVSCSKDDEEDPQPGETHESYINANVSTTWNYYSFAEDKVVGTADESAESNAVWAARKDWDIAVQRYHIRTNSGEFTTVGARGGVFTCDSAATFSSILKVPSDAQFVEDKVTSYPSMGGSTVTRIQSKAIVVGMKEEWNEEKKQWVTMMPPIYLQRPVYIFRTADGNNYYKVLFTQYVNEDAAAGHVKFNLSKISL
ncbi:hypothetical protein FACS1894160_4010 [Bacteroidia bacterium]|nr:hypothetical protein FACS1894160_4010 [Bacteroidia bacterium]